jgi:hypothetical protein
MRRRIFVFLSALFLVAAFEPVAKAGTGCLIPQHSGQWAISYVDTLTEAITCATLAHGPSIPRYASDGSQYTVDITYVGVSPGSDPAFYQVNALGVEVASAPVAEANPDLPIPARDTTMVFRGRTAPARGLKIPRR